MTARRVGHALLALALVMLLGTVVVALCAAWTMSDRLMLVAMVAGASAAVFGLVGLVACDRRW